MRQLVESLKRLYEGGKITQNKILEMHHNKVLSDDEMNYILSK